MSVGRCGARSGVWGGGGGGGGCVGDCVGVLQMSSSDKQPDVKDTAVQVQASLNIGDIEKFMSFFCVLMLADLQLWPCVQDRTSYSTLTRLPGQCSIPTITVLMTVSIIGARHYILELTALYDDQRPDILASYARYAVFHVMLGVAGSLPAWMVLVCCTATFRDSCADYNQPFIDYSVAHGTGVLLFGAFAGLIEGYIAFTTNSAADEQQRRRRRVYAKVFILIQIFLTLLLYLATQLSTSVVDLCRSTRVSFEASALVGVVEYVSFFVFLARVKTDVFVGKRLRAGFEKWFE